MVYANGLIMIESYNDMCIYIYICENELMWLLESYNDLHKYENWLNNVIENGFNIISWYMQMD